MTRGHWRRVRCSLGSPALTLRDGVSGSVASARSRGRLDAEAAGFLLTRQIIRFYNDNLVLPSMKDGKWPPASTAVTPAQQA